MSHHNVRREQKENQTGLRDWRGTPIEVGSIVVYPGRYGSTMWVSEGVVEEVGVRVDWHADPLIRVRRVRDSYGDTESTSLIRKISRVTVIK